MMAELMRGNTTTTDRLGDALANNADHNRRHGGVLNKVYDMMLSVAVGQVVKGDKEDKDKMAAFNSGTIVIKAFRRLRSLRKPSTKISASPAQSRKKVENQIRAPSWVVIVLVGTST